MRRMGQACGLWLCLAAAGWAADPLPEGLLGYWEFDEGTGSEVIRDRTGLGHDASLEGAAGACRWVGEDDRGLFLQVLGTEKTRLRVAASPTLQVKGPFSIVMHFSCDLGALPQAEAALVRKGDEGPAAYAVSVRKDGKVVVHLQGVEPADAVFDARIQPNRDYVACVSHDGNSLSLYLDGRRVDQVPCKGAVADSEMPLYIAGAAGSPFVGSLYMVRLYNRALSEPEISGLFMAATVGPLKAVAAAVTGAPPVRASAGGPAQSLLNNPHAIVFGDFLKMEPRDAITLERMYDRWWYRAGVTFTAATGGVLHANGSIDVIPDLSYAPNLKGRYNLYAGMRGVWAPTAIQLKTSAMDQFATLSLPLHTGTSHTNYDILWARDVAMDGQRIILHACSAVYLNHLTFVPTDKDGAGAKVDDMHVRYEARRTGEDYIRESIAHKKKEKLLVERTYRDERPLPALSDASKRRGYILFPIHWMDLVFPCTKPTVDPGQMQLQVSAARGEFEPAAFALHALQDLDSLTVALAGPLKGDAGELAVTNIDLREVRTLKKRTTNWNDAHNAEFMDLPCWLEPVAPWTLAKGTTREYWLTLEVPRDLPAGVYRGAVSVRAGAGEAQSVSLTLTVHPFELAEPGMNIGMFARSTLPLPGCPEVFSDMKRHGMTSVAFGGPSGLEITGPAEAPRVSFENANLARTLDMFVAAGFSGDFLWPYADDQIQVYCNKLLPDEAAFTRAYAAIIRQIGEECGKRKWPRILFQPYDEVPSNPACFPALVRELRAVKLGGGTTEADHLWLKTSRPGCQPYIDQCVSNIDIFNLGYSGKPISYVDPWPEILETGRKLGRPIYTYNINNAMTIPEMETMRFSAGWFFRSLGAGCSGYYLYIYQEPVGDAWNDFDGGTTDWIQNYPAAEDRKGGPALYWEAFREGIDDIRYIVTLENLVKKYRNDPRAAALIPEAEQRLKDLAGSLDVARIRRECVRLESQWEKTETLPDGKRIAEGRFRMPSGWTFERYDEARQAVAECIIKIQSACAGKH